MISNKSNSAIAHASQQFVPPQREQRYQLVRQPTIVSELAAIEPFAGAGTGNLSAGRGFQTSRSPERAYRPLMRRGLSALTQDDLIVT
jgi:hypothetical protein